MQDCTKSVSEQGAEVMSYDVRRSEDDKSDNQSLVRSSADLEVPTHAS